jgi:hypothetical protein
MRLYPGQLAGIVLVVTMTSEAFAMRSEGRTSAQFLEVTQPVAKHDNVIWVDY